MQLKNQSHGSESKYYSGESLGMYLPQPCGRVETQCQPKIALSGNNTHQGFSVVQSHGCTFVTLVVPCAGKCWSYQAMERSMESTWCLVSERP